MGEMDSSYQSNGLDKLRGARLRPQAVRTVLWFASYRIMDDTTFDASDRRQAGIYLETIFGTLDDMERQDAEVALKKERPTTRSLSMGHMMSWAASDVRTATFLQGFDPSNRDHQDAMLHMKLNVGLTEAHVETAYQKYLEYREAQVQDAAWRSLRWF